MYNYLANNSIRNLVHNVFPDFVPNFEAFVLDNDAKLTDFVSTVNPYFGFVLSERAKTILQNLEKFLPPYNKTDQAEGRCNRPP